MSNLRSEYFSFLADDHLDITKLGLKIRFRIYGNILVISSFDNKGLDTELNIYFKCLLNGNVYQPKNGNYAVKIGIKSPMVLFFRMIHICDICFHGVNIEIKY